MSGNNHNIRCKPFVNFRMHSTMTVDPQEVYINGIPAQAFIVASNASFTKLLRGTVQANVIITKLLNPKEASSSSRSRP